jgi:hypothetical protein
VSSEEPARVLNELEELIESFGETGRVDWVRERREVLEGDSAERKRAVRAEIADALVGMGSIHDAYSSHCPKAASPGTRCATGKTRSLRGSGGRCVRPRSQHTGSMFTSCPTSRRIASSFQ